VHEWELARTCGPLKRYWTEWIDMILQLEKTRLVPHFILES